MKYTDNLNLKKPEYTDPVDIQDFNDNADTLELTITRILDTIQETPEYSSNAELIDIRTGYDGTQYGRAGEAVRALGREIEKLREIVDGGVSGSIEADDLGFYRDNTGYVYPTYKGVRSKNSIYLGSIGNEFKVRNTTGSSAFSVALGNEAKLAYVFTYTESGNFVGNGTASYYLNGNLLLNTVIEQGETFFDCGPYLAAGTNEVSVTVTNLDGESKTLNWTIEAIELRVTDTFDYTLAYSGDVTYKFTAYGNVEKTINFILDGVAQETMLVESSGRQNTKVFSGLGHGLHSLEVYASATVSGTYVESNHLVYDVIVIKDDAVDPVISINCNQKSVTQGELVDIPSIVYDPLATESTITRTISYLVDSEYVVYKEENYTIDRSLQHWTTRDYPVGTVKFTVTLRDVSRSIVLTVAENSLPISPATNDLELHLTSASRSNFEENPDVWEYNGITTTFDNVNWASSGWMTDEIGDTALHLAGGSTATIHFQPFNSDLRITGKTIEFDFAIRDVNNRDANVISCMSGDMGIDITADTATLYSALSSVDCRFRDERRMRVAFVIESRNEYRLMSVYLDGVLTRAKQYATTDNFQQTNPVDIVIGSPYCAVDIYNIRSYSTALTQEELKNNYICDIADIITRAEIYDKNNLYDSDGTLMYEKVKKQIPVMTITGTLPASKGDKKNVYVTFEDPNDEEMNFYDVYTNIDVQGTSSQWYVRKNWKIKMYTDETKETKFKYAHVKGGIPTNVFCMKADYAEATSTHNTQIANFVHTLYSDKTPAQLADPRCRTTIQGFPCVIYHKKTEDSIPEFLGKYNFNHDKGSEEAFGFTDGSECWEFCNNTSVACNFTGNIPESYSMKDENDNEVGWVNDFERRFPEHDDIADGKEDSATAISNFRAMHDWVVSTRSYDLTNKDVLEQYRAEFQERFNLHKMLVYYIFTFFMLMVDQRAKNMFLTFWPETGKWEPWFYDNDTCLGINNEGHLIFDYYHEDTDIMPDNSKVYNGQDSVLWINFRVAFAKEIQELYQELRGDGKLTYETLRDQFVVNGSDKWSESIYNEDADYKYLSMLRSDGDATNVPQVRGTGEHHLEYFLDGRFNYCDSRWYAPDYANDYVVLRVNTPTTYGNIVPNADITVTPFSTMYAGVRYRANGTLQQTRLENNVAYTFKAPVASTDEDRFNDTETAIYGASQLSSIGDLAPLYPNYVDVSKATKLIELKVGDEDSTYTSRLATLSLGTNRLLKKLDIRNCANLTNPVNLTGCPSIEEVYAEGSSITSLELADSGYLRIVHLPETIVNLTIKNQDYLEDFTIAAVSNIKELNVTKSNGVPITDILLDAPLERVRLTNVDWSCEESELTTIYNKLLTCGGIDETGANTSKAVVSGIVRVPSLSEEMLKNINTNFPELMVCINGVIMCTVSYFNYDNTLLYVTAVEQGSNAVDIVAEGLIDTPVRPETIDYRYTYKGWNDSLENIQRSKSFVATYNVEYAVRFEVDDTVLYSVFVNHGDSVEDPIVSGKISTPTKEKTAQYEFEYSHWNIGFSNITDVTIVKAVFIEKIRSYVISFYNEDVLVSQYLREYGKMATYDESELPKKLGVDYPQDYKFLGWDKELAIVTGEETYYALFSESDHVLDSWATIETNINNGTYKTVYPLGSLKRETLVYDDGTTEDIELEVAGHNHDVLADGSGKAAISFIIKGVLDEAYMMSDSETLNRGSWINSDGREYLNNVIVPAMSNELRSSLVEVVKKTSAGGGSTDVNDVISTNDIIWAPSLIELIDTYKTTDIYAAEGTTYAQMIGTNDEDSRNRRIKMNSNGYAKRYWTRSPVAYSGSEYWMISTLGGAISTYSSYSKQGIVFGICVGKAN